MAVAMTVGATRIQILQETALSSLGNGQAVPSDVEGQAEPEGKQEACVA